jgi:hypothetical protein
MNIMKKTNAIILLLIGFFCLIPCSCSKSSSGGKIKGSVLLPDKIDIATVPKEAKVYIYLKDYSPVNGKDVLPWEAPTKKVIEHQINSLENHRINFEFKNLPSGLYGVSVLVDTGRPHVSKGSTDFTAFPGDYTGGTKDNIKLEDNQTVEVSIESGMYLTIPDGYDAPLYSPE